MESLSIKLPDPEVMLGIATPELWVPPQPAKRVTPPHLDQCSDEAPVEEQEGEELSARTIPRTEHAGHHREVNIAQSADPSVPLTERHLGQTSDFSRSLGGDQRVGNPSIGREPTCDPIGPRRPDRSDALILDEEGVDSSNAPQIIANLVDKQTVEDIYGHIGDARLPASGHGRLRSTSERLKADHDHLLGAKINGRLDWAVEPGSAIGVVASGRSRSRYLYGREKHWDRCGCADVLAT